MDNTNHNTPRTMNTRKNNEKVNIDKWKLNLLYDEAEEMLLCAGRTVSSSIMAADNPDVEELHNDALKDAARCYDRVALFMEHMHLCLCETKALIP